VTVEIGCYEAINPREESERTKRLKFSQESGIVDFSSAIRMSECQDYSRLFRSLSYGALN